MLAWTSISSWIFFPPLFCGWAGLCGITELQSSLCTSCCHHSVHEFTNKILKPAGLVVFADSVARPCHRMASVHFPSHPVTHSALPPLFTDIVTHLSIVPLLFIYRHLVCKKKNWRQQPRDQVLFLSSSCLCLTSFQPILSVAFPRGGLCENVLEGSSHHHVHAQRAGGRLLPGSQGWATQQQTQTGLGVSFICSCLIIYCWE